MNIRYSHVHKAAALIPLGLSSHCHRNKKTFLVTVPPGATKWKRHDNTSEKHDDKTKGVRFTGVKVRTTWASSRRASLLTLARDKTGHQNRFLSKTGVASKRSSVSNTRKSFHCSLISDSVAPRSPRRVRACRSSPEKSV